MSKKKSGDVLSRLTDPAKYTGAHKQRFDSDGKGRGLAGRDMGNEGKVTDISQVMRSNLRKANDKSPTRTRSKSQDASAKKTVAKEDKPKETPAPAEKKEVKRQSSSSSTSGPGKARSATLGGGSPKKKGDVLSRLTDPKNYTGAHKSRFDTETGKGKGLAGRDMGNEGKISDLSQMTRSSLHKSEVKSASSVKKTGTVSGVAPLHVQKFGTQAEKAKKITVWQNGDKHHKGVLLTVSKHINSFEKLLAEATRLLVLGTGAAQKMYPINKAEKKFATKLKGLDDVTDGEHYLVCGPEKIIEDKMPTAIFD